MIINKLQDVILAVVMMMSAITISSCRVSNSPDGMANEAIRQAEKDVPEYEDGLAPEIATIDLRKSAALKNLDILLREKSKGLKDSDDDMKYYRILLDNYKQARQIVGSHYNDMLEEESKNYVGKEIPVEFDRSEFSNANFRIFSIGTGAVGVDFTITPTEPIRRCLRLLALDKDGKVFSTTYPRIKCAAGATERGQTNIMLGDFFQASKLKITFSKW